ncbi:MAG: MBL fold metallo-hydrolase [Chitinivibrionales bacterium]|nr:MBL fold metallo-hydrolase [Chitinivibrionales bacterium]
MKLTVLCDDRTETPRCAAEHGLSIWIESGDMRVLFDTGQGKALASNAEALGVDLSRADAVVLSHGHYDHADGAAVVAQYNEHAPLYAHPAVTIRRYSRRSSASHHQIGMSSAATAALRAREVTWTTEPTRVGEGLLVTGPVPRLSQIEAPEHRLCLDSRCHVVDPLVDDQSLLIETARGLVLVLGCTHSGVINTLRYAARLTGCERFAAVVGGMHLNAVSASRMAATMAALENYGIGIVAPCHCTGEHAIRALHERFAERFVRTGVGTVFSFE